MKRPSQYSIRAAGEKSAEVWIYGSIGENWWSDESVTAASFARELAQLDAETITVRLNSAGGSVADGLAIYNALKRHPARVVVAIDGVALSIASLIAMAGDQVEMAENAMLMIHAPWSPAAGNAVELRQFADLLDKYAQAMTSSYVAKTGRPVDEISMLLTDGDDHWYGATEALEAKFVDRVVSAMPVTASFDLSKFNRVPAAAAVYAMEKSPMTQTTQPAAAAATTPAVDVEKIRAEAIASEAARRADISAVFDKFAATSGVPELLAQCRDDVQCTVQAAREKLLAHLGKDCAPLAGGYVATLEDERDKFRTGVAHALAVRAGLEKDDPRNNFRSHTLLELARSSAERLGRRTGSMSKKEIVAAAFTHTGSDFPKLLENIAEKAMMKGYEEADETFQRWTTASSLPDFKPASRVDLGVFPSLELKSEGAEYKSATIGERREKIQIATYGRKFSITREAVINDDLDSFSAVPRRMGRAAIRTIGNLVYAVLTSNPNMEDGVALFHASHGNLATGSAINTGSVDAMRVLMALQKDGASAALNIRLAYLLVPVALEGTARVVRESEFEVGASARNNTTPNTVRGTFEVISDPRLDAASATNWFGAANPAMHDTVEVAYLDGVRTPMLESQDGWDVDGVEMKVRMDAGVKALDFRTLAKNPN